MKDILDLDLQLYLRSILPPHDSISLEMIAYAESNHIPIVEPEIANFLQFLVGVMQPKHILEIGTAIGFSTIAMAKALPENGMITTVELTEERHQKAMEYFQKSDVSKKIHAILGDAREWMPTIREKYDMIFWDAAKGQYPEFLALTDQILEDDGLLVADNVLLNGWVYRLDYPNHRKKTMVYRMRDFLDSFRENEKYACTVLPLGDGVALIRKKGGIR